jgi:hypothetical protein
MINLEAKDIETFREQGWVIVDGNLPHEDLAAAQSAANALQYKVSYENTYPFKRIYHDYALTNNVAAIEAPFNKLIFQPAFQKVFAEVGLGQAILKLADWKRTTCTLARIHCSSGYKYACDWHKDGGNEGDAIQATLYLKDETGFRLVKKAERFDIETKYFGRVEGWRDVPRPAHLPDDAFQVISAKAGQILFFDANLLHQGIDTSPRFHFHMRFENSDSIADNANIMQNEHQDFTVVPTQAYSADYETLAAHFPQHQHRSIFFRLMKTVNYYFPALPIIKTLIAKKRTSVKAKPLIFANTAYQTK